MQFTPGKFVSLRVLKQFHFGPAQLDLPTDAIIEFDGLTLRFSGQEYAGSVLVGAVRAGWVVPVEDTESEAPRARPAGVKLHPATSTESNRGEEIDFGAATEEEVEVQSIKQPRHGSQLTHEPSEVTVRQNPEVSLKGPAPFDATVRRGDTDEVGSAVKSSGRQTKALVAEDPAVLGGNEDAIPVARLGSSPKTRFTVDGTTRDVEPKIERILVKPKAAKGAAPGRPSSKAPLLKKAASSKAEVPQARCGDDLAALLPDAAVTPGPEFQWDTKGHWRDRVKKAVEEYGDRPDLLNKIYAVETEGVVKNIKSALARR